MTSCPTAPRTGPIQLGETELGGEVAEGARGGARGPVLSPAAVRRLFAEVDGDGDGLVSLAEWRRVGLGPGPPSHTQGARSGGPLSSAVEGLAGRWWGYKVSNTSLHRYGCLPVVLCTLPRSLPLLLPVRSSGWEPPLRSRQRPALGRTRSTRRRRRWPTPPRPVAPRMPTRGRGPTWPRTVRAVTPPPPPSIFFFVAVLANLSNP